MGDVETLERISKNDPDLRKAVLSASPLIIADFKVLLDSLENNTNLEYIDLRENRIDDNMVSGLVGVLFKNKGSRVTGLDLRHNRITFVGAKVLCGYEVLRTLRLYNGNTIGKDGLALFINNHTLSFFPIQGGSGNLIKQVREKMEHNRQNHGNSLQLNITEDKKKSPYEILNGFCSLSTLDKDLLKEEYDLFLDKIIKCEKLDRISCVTQTIDSINLSFETGDFEKFLLGLLVMTLVQYIELGKIDFLFKNYLLLADNSRLVSSKFHEEEFFCLAFFGCFNRNLLKPRLSTYHTTSLSRNKNLLNFLEDCDKKKEGKDAQAMLSKLVRKIKEKYPGNSISELSDDALELIQGRVQKKITTDIQHVPPEGGSSLAPPSVSSSGRVMKATMPGRFASEKGASLAMGKKLESGVGEVQGEKNGKYAI